MKKRCDSLATFDFFAICDPFATFNWKWDSGIWIISLLGVSILRLFEKIASEENRPELGNIGSEKKINIKQKITFPEISAFREVFRLLWEQMKYVCVLWVGEGGEED